MTRDHGKTWTDVTPSQLSPWAKVSIMDASHFDVDTAYAAINTFRWTICARTSTARVMAGAVGN